MSKLKTLFTAKVRILTGLVVLLSLIAFTQISQGDSNCKGLIVLLDNTVENHFLDETDVELIATMNGDVTIENQSMDQIDIKEMEERLRANPYVSTSEIFKDLEGNLVIDVSLRRPIVRILRDDGQGAYVTADGKVMPVSDKFVSRVMLVSGATDSLIVDDFYQSENGRKVLDMYNFIYAEDFLRAQIAEMELNRRYEVILFPQITKQQIEFGALTDLEAKFRKLKIFYKEILPRKGWNSYDKVNLEYKDQIIAE